MISIRRATEQLAHQQAELRRQVDSLRQRAGELPDSDQRQQALASALRLERQLGSFWKARPGWIFLAGCAYVVGLIPAGIFWIGCLRSLDQPVPVLTAMWAYFLGHLGKYIPGKAMVLVLRIGALHHLGVKKLATTLTIFMETLTMMAVGGTVAAVCLLLLNHQWQWTVLASGLFVATFLPTLPPVMRWTLKKLQKGVDRQTLDQWLGKINSALLLRGWGLLLLTWAGNGASLYCVLRALPTAEFSDASQATIWLSALGACALAVVLGFVSMLPAGAGVREVVLTTVLAPIVGDTAALASAVWLRLTWLAAEFVAAGIVWCMRQWTIGRRVDYVSTQSASQRYV